jgi:hypothetical protein
LSNWTSVEQIQSPEGSFNRFFIDKYGAAIGKYYLKTTRPSVKQMPIDATPYRINSPLAKDIVNWFINKDVAPAEVTFDYTNSPNKVAFIEQLVGQSGWMTVEKLTIESFECEDYMLISCICDNGEKIYSDIAEQMLTLNGTEHKAVGLLPERNIVQALNDEISAQRADIITDSADRNRNFFEEEMDKLDSWADDVKAGLEKELHDLDAEIKLRKNEAKRTSRLEEKVKMQRLIKDLEKKRSEKRMNLYQAQDDVDAKKEDLLSKVEAMLAQKVQQTKLFTIKWRIV